MARRRRLPATTLGYASPDTLERSRTARRKSYSSPDTQERATKVRVRKAIQSDPAARTEYINRALDTPAPNRREERQILGPQAARELNRARQRMAAHRAKVMGGTLEPTTGPTKPLSERETREVYGRAIGQTGLFDVAAQAPKEQTPGTIKKRLDEIDTGIRETFLGEDINRAIENTRQGKPMIEGVDFSDVLGEGALLGVPAPLRGVAGLRAGARAVKAGEGLTEASRATGEAYRTATPIRSTVRKALRKLPPVPAGHVRLYRGEGATEELDPNEVGDLVALDRGRWFTDKPEIAEEYARRRDGNLYYLDLPVDEARPWSRLRESDSGEKWVEYRPPRKIAERKKPLPVVDPSERTRYNVQSRSYYRNILRGADPEVLRELPAKPQIEDISRAFNAAISKGDFNAASVLQEEFEHIVEGTRTMSAPFARGKRQIKARRTMKLNEQETQFPASQARSTAYVQKLLDRASERLTTRVNKLRESDSLLARSAGRALTPASARGRLPKQAGKHLRDEVKRGRAARAEDVRTLRGVRRGKIPFTREEGADMAHSWYVQLPPESRNAEGLKLVRGKLDEQRQYYTSGEASDDIELAMADLRAESKLANAEGDTNRVFEIMGEIASLKAIQADIPTRIADLSENLTKLGRVIDNPVKVDDDVIESARVMMRERTDEMIKAGLDPERAALRVGLVSRWLGLDNTPGVVEMSPLELVRGAARELDTRAYLRDPEHRRQVAELAADIKANGIREPLRVRSDGTLEDGLHRALAAVAAGLTRVPVLREGATSTYSGGEIYFGHRAGKVRGSRASGFPGGISTGKTRLPEGVGTANKMVLAQTGRMRQSLETVIEDWQAAQIYKWHNIAKDEMAKMGEEIVGRPKPGYVVINPRGHQLPRTWKVDREKKLAEEGFTDPDEILVTDVDEYIRNYMASGADAERLIKQAAEAGHLEDLRQVPADVVSRYYGQFQTPKLGLVKPTAMTTPGAPQNVGFGDVVDFANNALYISLIYANPGHIPANVLANLLMAGAHQGAFLPFNLLRAGQLLTSGEDAQARRLIDLVKAEIGVTANEAVTEGRHLKGVGNVVSSFADTPYRVSSLMHELAREGIVSKVNPVLTKRDFQNIERFLSDERNRPLLNDIKDRAVQAMVDFERLGPNERAIAGKLLFIWRWMRGGSRYPARFIADHPLRSLFGAYVVAGAPGAPEEIQNKIRETLPNVAEGMPPWLAGALEAGETVVDNKTYDRVMPTRTISPVSTPWEVGGALVGRPGAQTAAEFLNPGLRSLYQVASKQNPFGRDAESYRESALQAGERIVPQIGLTKDLLNPEGGGLYPEDATREGRLKRAARIFPIAIDSEEAEAARVREGMEGEPSERKRREFIEESKEAGLGDPPPDVLKDFDWKQRLDEKLSDEAEEGPTRRLNYGKAALIAARLYDEKYPGGGVEKLAKTLRTQGEAKELYEEIRPLLYPVYAEWNRELDAILDARLEEEPTD